MVSFKAFNFSDFSDSSDLLMIIRYLSCSNIQTQEAPE
jgi:hypothetical protein